jgi:hypothetical protein
MEPSPPILEYHVRRHRINKRLAVICILLAAVSAGVVASFMLVVLARWNAYRQQREIQAGFLSLMEFAKERTGPVAAIVEEKYLAKHPDALDQLAHFTNWRERDYFGPDQPSYQFRVLTDRASARIFWLKSSTVYLGQRRASDGKDYIIALDVAVSGCVLTFYSECVDPRKPDAMLETMSRASGREAGKQVAQFSFIDDPPTAVVTSGTADPADPSRFSFEVIHGEHHDKLTAIVTQPGMIEFVPTVEPRVENRWQIPGKP